MQKEECNSSVCMEASMKEIYSKSTTCDFPLIANTLCLKKCTNFETV